MIRGDTETHRVTNHLETTKKKVECFFFFLETIQQQSEAKCRFAKCTCIAEQRGLPVKDLILTDSCFEA